MIGEIKFKERGPTPRGMARALNEYKRAAGHEMGKVFHLEQSDLRFDPSHARRAGYANRSLKYQRRKRTKFGHNNPLEYSGDTRRRIRSQGALISVTATSKHTTVRARYPGARTLNRTNFRAKSTPIRMAEEFRRIPVSEARELAHAYDAKLDQLLKGDIRATTRKIS